MWLLGLALTLGLGAFLVWDSAAADASIASGGRPIIQVSEVFRDHNKSLRHLSATQSISPCIYLPLIAHPSPSVAILELGADPSSIAADGIATSTVTTRVKDASLNPLEGVTVTFTTTLGMLSHHERASDTQGTASVMLTSAVTPGVSTVSAMAGDVSQRVEVTFTVLPEVRALWVTRWAFTDTEDVAHIMERAAYAHFNTILFQVRGQADAYYDSQYEPWAARLTGSVTETLGQDPGWDPLRAALDEAHSRGLQLHAWVNVYPVWVTSEKGHYPPQGTDPVHFFWPLSHAYPWADWRQHYLDDKGDPKPMLLTDTQYGYVSSSPAVTLTVERVISVCQDIVTNYKVDGLHLDYVRYAGPEFSHDPISLDRFSVVSSTISWEEWQRSQVTGLVDRVYQEVVLPRPNLMLTAAVWPIYRDRWGWTQSDGYDGYYQDSQGWMQGGHLDGIAPMLYANLVSMGGQAYSSRFYTLVQDFVDHGDGRFLLAGIYGGTADGTTHYDDFEDIAASISLARQAGATGQAVFSYSLLEDRGYWDDLWEGPYRHPTVLPEMGWR